VQDGEGIAVRDADDFAGEVGGEGLTDEGKYNE
jgi:hypothetical protein